MGSQHHATAAQHPRGRARQSNLKEHGSSADKSNGPCATRFFLARRFSMSLSNLLPAFFEDAIMERNRLLQEAEVAAGRMVSALAAATAPHTHDAILPPLRRFQTTHRGLCFVAIVLCRAAHPKSGALNHPGFVCRLTFRESSTLCSLRWPSRRSS